MNSYESLSHQDSILIDRLRGGSILLVVLGHLGLGWLFLPYSSYTGIFLTVLFFCSGYIFFYLYYKDRNICSFLIKRILSIVIPFYILYLFSVMVAAIYQGSTQSLNFDHLCRALLLAPKYEEMPFPLGQIWYLRVLLFCTIVCPFIFYFAQFSRWFLLLGVAPSVALSAIQTFHPIHSNFYWQGHNFFQEIVYGGYFFLAAFISTTNWRKNKLSIFGLSCLMAAIAIATFPLTSRSYVLGDHAYAPDTFYFFLGIFSILLVLSLTSFIEWIYSHNKAIDKLLKYCGVHSYGIYLSHSFYIVFTEVVFGWKGVFSQPLLATAKIIFVVVASMVSAYPITLISKAVLSPIKQNSKDRTKAPRL